MGVKEMKHAYSVMVNGSTLSHNGETIMCPSMQKALDLAYDYAKRGERVIVNDELQNGYFNAFRVKYLSSGMGCECISIDPADEQKEFAADDEYRRSKA
jgi:hypothetical protein